MKAITIKQPYATLICMGLKDIENRTWKTKFRGRLYIHAAADAKNVHTFWNELVSDEAYDKMLEVKSEYEWCKMEFEKSAIIGYVDVVDCTENHTSPWAIEGNYHWVLANPRMFYKPITQVKGKLSLWDCSQWIV